MKRRCYCPGDCNCKVEWRTTYCGCMCLDLSYEFIDGKWRKVR